MTLPSARPNSNGRKTPTVAEKIALFNAIAPTSGGKAGSAPSTSPSAKAKASPPPPAGGLRTAARARRPSPPSGTKPSSSAAPARPRTPHRKSSPPSTPKSATAATSRRRAPSTAAVKASRSPSPLPQRASPAGTPRPAPRIRRPTTPVSRIPKSPTRRVTPPSTAMPRPPTTPSRIPVRPDSSLARVSPPINGRTKDSASSRPPSPTVGRLSEPSVTPAKTLRPIASALRDSPAAEPSFDPPKPTAVAIAPNSVPNSPLLTPEEQRRSLIEVNASSSQGSPTTVALFAAGSDSPDSSAPTVSPIEAAQCALTIDQKPGAEPLHRHEPSAVTKDSVASPLNTNAQSRAKLQGSSTLNRILPLGRRKTQQRAQLAPNKTLPLPALPPLPALRPLSIVGKGETVLPPKPTPMSVDEAVEARQGKRQHVERELAETEKAYLEDLYVLYETFYQPALARPTLFPPKVMRTLFSNFGQVIACATYLSVLFRLAFKGTQTTLIDRAASRDGGSSETLDPDRMTQDAASWGSDCSTLRWSPVDAALHTDGTARCTSATTSSATQPGPRSTAMATHRNVSSPFPPVKPPRSKLRNRPSMGSGLGVAATSASPAAGSVPTSLPTELTSGGVNRVDNTHRWSQTPSLASTKPASMYPSSQRASRLTVLSQESGASASASDGFPSKSMRTSFASLVTASDFDQRPKPVSKPPTFANEFPPLISPFPSASAIATLVAMYLQDASITSFNAADAFSALAREVREVYTHYCTNFDAAMACLTSLQQSDSDIRAFFERQQRLLSGKTHSWDLASLLIKPVQRVLKYPLLFQQLAKLSDPHSADHTAFATAHQKAEGIADHINLVKKRKALVTRVIETNHSGIEASHKRSEKDAFIQLAPMTVPRRGSTRSRKKSTGQAPVPVNNLHVGSLHSGVDGSQSFTSLPSAASIGDGSSIGTSNRVKRLSHSKSHTHLRADSQSSVQSLSSLKEFSHALRSGIVKTLTRTRTARGQSQSSEPGNPALAPRMPEPVEITGGNQFLKSNRSMADISARANSYAASPLPSRPSSPDRPKSPTALESENAPRGPATSRQRRASFSTLVAEFETQLRIIREMHGEVDDWCAHITEWAAQYFEFALTHRDFLALVPTFKADVDRRVKGRPSMAADPFAGDRTITLRQSRMRKDSGDVPDGYVTPALGLSRAPSAVGSRRVSPNASLAMLTSGNGWEGLQSATLGSPDPLGPPRSSTPRDGLAGHPIEIVRPIPRAGPFGKDGPQEGRPENLQEIPLSQIIRKGSSGRPALAMPVCGVPGSPRAPRSSEDLEQELMKRIFQFSHHAEEVKLVIISQTRQALQTDIYPNLQFLVGLFHNPALVIKRHSERYAAYLRQKTLDQQGADPLPTERHLAGTAEEYLLLGAQLYDELPVFLRHTAKFFTTIVQRLRAIQMDFYEQCALSLRDYMFRGRNAFRVSSGALGQIAQDHRLALNVPMHPRQHSGLVSTQTTPPLGVVTGTNTPLDEKLNPIDRITASAVDLPQWQDEGMALDMVPIHPSMSARSAHHVPEPSATVALSLTDRLDRIADNVKWAMEQSRVPSKRFSPTRGAAQRSHVISDSAHNLNLLDDYATAVAPPRVKSNPTMISRESSISRRRAVLIDFLDSGEVSGSSSMVFNGENGLIGADDNEDQRWSLLDMSLSPSPRDSSPFFLGNVRPIQRESSQPHQPTSSSGSTGHMNPFATPDEASSNGDYFSGVSFNDRLLATQSGSQSPTRASTPGSLHEPLSRPVGGPPARFVPKSMARQMSNPLTRLGSSSAPRLPDVALTRSDSWGLSTLNKRLKEHQLRQIMPNSDWAEKSQQPSALGSSPSTTSASTANGLTDTSPTITDPFSDRHGDAESNSTDQEPSPLVSTQSDPPVPCLPEWQPFDSARMIQVGFTCVAIYPYSGRTSEELSFAHGDTIKVSRIAPAALSDSRRGHHVDHTWWWYGELCDAHRSKGWFPASFAIKA
ncbi:hypothetical protein H4R34_004613 [Dimargaris verticillata]|uniref:DH domain-containing protein n=1 Tax=Dimargaris verticillata TaxID=2761393 RepID=A0A9W8B3V0_9FUNG|nr:hypothetical protein H4R34_004613 [Dimargaris verticillata]